MQTRLRFEGDWYELRGDRATLEDVRAAVDVALDLPKCADQCTHEGGHIGVTLTFAYVQPVEGEEGLFSYYVDARNEPHLGEGAASLSYVYGI